MADRAGRGGRSGAETPGVPEYPAATEYGQGTEWPEEAREFAAKQAARVRTVVVTDEHRRAAAEWLAARAAEQDPAVLVRELIAGAEARPDHDTLVRAQVVLNELGRDERFTVAIKRHLTPDIVGRIAARDEREG